MTSVTVGAYLAAQNSPLTDAVPFVLLTLLVLSLPSLTLIAFGERAERYLPKTRDWMDANSWIVTELVLLIFMAIALNNFLG
ncbi:GAP family protein [Natrinema caseinilyticum]|uniref:GAP family protein n=1 Tax=Natrinema caseinilyticum TaxID=2961570 RepID=UPI0020C5B234|nr:GAP family protein [Natrinema caseinilyticum]